MLGFMNNSGQFFLFLSKTYVVTTIRTISLSDAVLKRVQNNICFCEGIWKIIPYLTLYPFLSGTLPYAGGKVPGTNIYRIFPAIRQGFCPTRMTSNN